MSFLKKTAGMVSCCLNQVLPSRHDGVGILLYHRTTSEHAGAPTPEINVTPEQFRSQLTGLKQRGFSFLSIGEVLSLRAREESLPKQSVVVTFDDGYLCNYEFAWPILRELGIPATMFVSTAYLDASQPFPFDRWGTLNCKQVPEEAYRPLTIAQCREMQEEGTIQIGAHTHSHRDFRGKPAKLREDLLQCMSLMRQHFGLTDIPFAFPYGRVQMGYAGGTLSEVARDLGLTCALTTECHANDLASDPFHWGRFNVYEWDTPGTLAAKLNGWYGWAPKLQERLKRTPPAARTALL